RCAGRTQAGARLPAGRDPFAALDRGSGLAQGGRALPAGRAGRGRGRNRGAVGLRAVPAVGRSACLGPAAAGLAVCPPPAEDRTGTMQEHEMPDLVLYSNPMSRGRIARWMLEEVGQPYEVRYLDYGPAMKSPGYLAINPMGKVPALVHGDRVVTEYAAICAYLADAFPEAGLAPEDRSAYYRWL